jgi:hypothetical protein
MNGSDKVQGQNRPEDRVRIALQSVRAKMFLRFGEKKSKQIALLALIGFFAIIVLTLSFFLMRIRTIEVTGDLTMFNEGEIIAAAEIAEGDRLFSKSGGRIKRNIYENLPIASKVKVRKSLFGKITISIEFDDAEYYCEYEGEYYALDRDLRVLDKSDTKTRYSTYGAVMVVLPEIRQPKLGEHIVFYYTVEETDTEGELLYEVEKAEKYDYVKQFLSTLYESPYYGGADGVIVEHKFDVTLIYSQKFKIRFGDVRGLEVKFRVLDGILAEGSMEYADKASIDLSDPSAAIARPDPTLDLSDFVD